MHHSVGAVNLHSLWKRDRGRCLYCLRSGRQLLDDERWTVDHIIPQCRFPSRSIATYWENCALSCSTCNRKKGNRTPEQAGMTLHGVPLEPTRWMLIEPDLLECQRAFVRWSQHGGPVPVELEGMAA
jgi:5-methylcytosine-specific restriction endonuclease McrA